MLVNPPLIASSERRRRRRRRLTRDTCWLASREWILVSRLAGDWEFRRRKWRRISLRLSYRVSKPLKVKEEEEGEEILSLFFDGCAPDADIRSIVSYGRVDNLALFTACALSFENSHLSVSADRRFRVFYFFVPRAWKGYRWRFSSILSPFVYIVILDACIYME